jgi:hypothetical protein
MSDPTESGPETEPGPTHNLTVAEAIIGNSAAIDSLDVLTRRDLRQDIGLKKFYAIGALVGTGLQLAAADVAFYFYGHGLGWHVPPSAISAWLGATVIEVIGIVLVITKYLFSPRASGTGASMSTET